MPLSPALHRNRTLPIVRLLLSLIPVFAVSSALAAEQKLFAADDCRGAEAARYSGELMQRKIAAYQILSEEALTLRAESVTYLTHLKEKQSLEEPLLGSEISQLSAGAAELMNKRKRLWQVATAHECWLDTPIPEDPRQARIQATGITMSLAAALTLYDNYLAAVALYREQPFLRQHLNAGDPGYRIPEGELRRIAASFASARNRARVRRGLIWYEKHGSRLARSDNDQERYLAELVEQSPSYAMVRRIRPLKYAGNVLDLVGTVSIDTIHKLQSEGVSFSSMMFGNMVGLVESRRGKLDDRPEILNRVRVGLQAGDVLLEKTPFRLTDSFIPGHWGHAAVWIGRERELRELDLWNHPLVVRHRSAIRNGRGVVEALRSGVEMNNLEHFMNVDDLAVLRHRNLNPNARRQVILQALRQVGKAYDFNFDTQSVNRIVCSELVYHAYGDIQWPTDRKLGRVVVSPDNIAQKAVAGGPFEVAMLYHDGKRVEDSLESRLTTLIEPRVINLAQGAPDDVSP